MNLRPLGRTGMMVGEVALGCEHLQGKDESLVREVILAALEGGVNFLDVFMSEPNVRTNIGNTLKGCRERVLIQGHIGALWIDGQYERARDLERNKRFFDDLLKRLQTDYMDVGMIHFVDDMSDWDSLVESDTMQYVLSLKKAGVIRSVGMSSHNPLTALKAVRTGLIDVLMFSLNPAYDIMPSEILIDDYFKPDPLQGLSGIDPTRAELYRACEAGGVAITTMKTLGAGMLLNEKASPFGKALTMEQCIHYALTRPAVAAVMIGAQNTDEVKAMLAYENASAEQRDYALALMGTQKASADGRCMYCNHCLPCPSSIDIAAVNKYLDIARYSDSIPETVREHYGAMAAKASDCVQCGECEARCPFGVPVREKMDKAIQVFGK